MCVMMIFAHIFSLDFHLLGNKRALNSLYKFDVIINNSMLCSNAFLSTGRM